MYGWIEFLLVKKAIGTDNYYYAIFGSPTLIAVCSKILIAACSKNIDAFFKMSCSLRQNLIAYLC